jgi:pyruvate/2-oxoglutarate dehydrogenase complex dihydrolipoamide dehydrogenase (E3) component
MSQPERVEVLILGSGEGGKKMAWHMARSGRRTAVVERKWIGGSCRNIACLPSKNEIWSARVAHLARHAAQFGTMISGPVTTDMARVRQRKRNMVEAGIARHIDLYQTTGGELIMGTGRFVAPKTLEVRLNDGGARVPAGDQVFVDIGTHAAFRAFPASMPPGRSPISRRWSSTTCRRISSCSAVAMSVSKWPRLIAASAAA